MTGRQTALVTISLLCLLIAGFFSCFEKKKVEVPTPSTLEAAQNPYLGLTRLLEAMGHEIVVLDGVQSLDPLPPTDATLVMTTRRRETTKRRSYALLSWVEAGGHLIVRAQNTWRDRLLDGEFDEWTADLDAEDLHNDLLLYPFELYALETYEDEEGEEDDADAPLPELSEEEAEMVEDIAEAVESWSGAPTQWDHAKGSLGDAEDLTLAFVNLHWSVPNVSPVYSVGDETGAHLVSLAHGDGFLTAVTDQWFLLNRQFGEHDHARAIVELARLGGRRGPVYILLSEDFPGLLTQVLTYAWPATLSLGILVLAWLWRSSPRFGPTLPDPAPERREWIEHLDAVGAFHWRQDEARGLIASTRSGVLRLIETRHPALARLSPRDRNIVIADGCGLHRNWVRRALDENDFPDAEASVARTISYLERIRSSL